MATKASPVIIHDKEAKLILMTFPTACLPSDEEIRNNCHIGLLDVQHNPRELIEQWHENGLARRIADFINRTYPACDEEIYALTPEGIIDRDAHRARAANVLQMPRPPSDHHCDDANCPHKAAISPLLMMTLMAGPDGKDLDLGKWQPFAYPIISMTEAVVNNFSFMMSLDTHKREVQAVRYIMRYQLDLSKTNELKIPRSADLVEAIYFPDALPDKFSLLTNTWEQVTVIPNRGYNFMGMTVGSSYSEKSITFETKAATLDVCLISWMFLSKKVSNSLTANTINVTFETHDKQSVIMRYVRGQSVWVPN
ncbi:MAG: hypothetical protein ACMG6E_05285 [Candidatus Roizmanbacteria bacterium]